MSDIFRALGTAAALLFAVLVFIGIITAAAVKRGEAGLAKHNRH